MRHNIPDSPGGDVLALPANALLTKGEKDSLMVKSIISRAGATTNGVEDV